MDAGKKARLIVKTNFSRADTPYKQVTKTKTEETFDVTEIRPFGDLVVTAIKNFPNPPTYIDLTFLAYGIPFNSDLYSGNVPNFTQIVDECKRKRVMPGVRAEIGYYYGPCALFMHSPTEKSSFAQPYNREVLNQITGGGKFHCIDVNFGDSPAIAFQGAKRFIQDGLLDLLLKRGYVPVKGELWFNGSPTLIHKFEDGRTTTDRFLFSMAGHGEDVHRLEIDAYDEGVPLVDVKLEWFKSVVTTYLRKCADRKTLSWDARNQYELK